MKKIRVPKHLIGSRIVGNGYKVIISEEVTDFEFNIIKEHYPMVSEVIEKKSKEIIEDKEK